MYNTRAELQDPRPGMVAAFYANYAYNEFSGVYLRRVVDVNIKNNTVTFKSDIGVFTEPMTEWHRMLDSKWFIGGK